MTRQAALNRIAGTAFLFTFVLLEAACGQDNRSVEFGKIVQVDPGLNRILTRDAKLEKLIGGFGLLEGPVWSSGYLLFSDMKSHVIYKWHPESGLSVFLKTGFTKGGPNGLAFDKKGRLVICEHGNRRVSRLETDGSLTVLAERYRGKRLNSPNDLVYRSDGLLYFTDPPYGLPGKYADPQKDLPYSGIFRFSEGNLELLSEELSGPNGLTFSPDEKYLYVGDDNQGEPVIQRYEVNPDGTLSKGEVFFNAGSVTKATSLDGMKSDIEGNLYVTASTGMIIISPTGKHLGTLQVPEGATNIAWGDDDQKMLYVTGAKSLYRIRISIPGSPAFRGQPIHSVPP
ncbi:MAG TPA: SMP-30/gluconolactonase/LRE family protein [Nitrospiraceae bacterium]|nr:SMP-30/gluconolactonase/LRE family protein [Nitrospiraceae bacterium]